MIISIPKEILPGENRVACIPDVAAKFIKAGYEVQIEKDAGLKAGYTNEQYEHAGAKVIEKLEDLYANADIVLKVQRPIEHPTLGKNEIDLLKKGTILISFVYVLHYPEVAKKCAERGVELISMDMIPRTTLAQKMDALSSQANLAGYKSVLMTANELGKIFPLMMTAAGTISPAKVVIMGAGVAGLQALGTAKRLGAVVEVSDIRPSVKEEVQSLGGKFIEVETDENMQDADKITLTESSVLIGEQIRETRSGNENRTMKSKKRLIPMAVAAATVIAATFSQAATISWTVATITNTEADVSNIGTTVIAASRGITANVINVRSLSTSPSTIVPQWPCVVYSQLQTSAIIKSSFNSFLMARIAC